LLPEFFGAVKQGAYSRAAKALVKANRLDREKEGVRPALDPTERLSLPAPPAAPARRAASLH
jgi:hypothetical protein